MAKIDNSVKCECCGEETDISYERTRFLRWLVDNDHMQKGHYIQVVNKLELPDPDRKAKENRREILGKIFVIDEELPDIEDEEVIAKLEMLRNSLREELKTSFGPNQQPKSDEFDSDWR